MQDDRPDFPKTEIKFADHTVIDALDDYVQEVLESLAVHLGQPGIARAFVSDESCVSDFLPCGFDGEDDSRRLRMLKTLESEEDPEKRKRRQKIFDRLDQCKTRAEGVELLKRVAGDLEIHVHPTDYIYEVAIRLRDK